MLHKIKWLWQYYRRHIYLLSVLIFFTPIQTVFQVTIPQLFGFSVDLLSSGEVPDEWLAMTITQIGASWDISPIASFGVAFMILGVIATTLYATVQCHRAWMNTRLELDFRQNAFNNLTDKGPDFFNKFRTGDLVTRMTDDVAEKLSWFACSGIFRLYEALLTITFVVIMMLKVDPWLTLWTAGPLPILVIIFFLSASALDSRYAKLQTRISSFNDVMEACFTGVRVVKAYVRESAQKSNFTKAASQRRQAEIDSVKLMTVVDTLYMYIWQVALVIVLLFGGYNVINSGLSIGSMAAFIYYVVYLVFPMFDIGQFLVKSRQSAVSIDRLMELEKVPLMVADKGANNNGQKLNGHLLFENVSFSFPESDRKIVDDVTIEIRSGQTVAFVGKVGCGKSWLANLIPRLVDPTGGSIKLDGQDIKMFSLEDLRGAIGYVPQEPVLFSDSIRNNILLGRDEITDDLIEWAIDVAQLKEEIDSLPDRLDTTVGTRGMMLSGGQKQRLGLARALVGKPYFLVLDDCTSALDSKTEAALWDRLHEVLPELSAVLITHRPGTLERADRIYVLDDGKIVESGTHNELIKLESHYHSIYKRSRLEVEVTK